MGNRSTQTLIDVTTLQLVFLLSGEHLWRRRRARRTGLSEMAGPIEILEEGLEDSGIRLGITGAAHFTYTTGGAQPHAGILLTR